MDLRLKHWLMPVALAIAATTSAHAGIIVKPAALAAAWSSDGLGFTAANFGNEYINDALPTAGGTFEAVNIGMKFTGALNTKRYLDIVALTNFPFSGAPNSGGDASTPFRDDDYSPGDLVLVTNGAGFTTGVYGVATWDNIVSSAFKGPAYDRTKWNSTNSTTTVAEPAGDNNPLTGEDDNPTNGAPNQVDSWWDNPVTKGNLYQVGTNLAWDGANNRFANSTLATGSLESYEQRVSDPDGDINDYVPIDPDPGNNLADWKINSYPTLIADYSANLGAVTHFSYVSHVKTVAEPWKYEIRATIDLEALGIAQSIAGPNFAVSAWWAMECGNDAMTSSRRGDNTQHPPVPEPSSLAMLSMGVMFLVRRKRREA